MHINLSPYVPLPGSEDALIVSKASDTLAINGEAFDFSSLPDGATIPADEVPCASIVGPVERIDGKLHLMLRLPYTTDELWLTFPDPIIDPPDGPIDLPIDTTVETEECKVDGGTLIVTTTKRWHQPPEVDEQFIPDPEPQVDEADDDLDA